MLRTPWGDTLRAYSPAVFSVKGLDESARVLLPEAALNSIMESGIQETPMLFQLTNPDTGIIVHAGVQSFDMDPGQICIPLWMMQNLQITDGSLIEIKQIVLPKATRTVLQPMDKKFLQLSNPKSILEKSLRTHPCLTQGTVIPIEFNGKTYKLKILKNIPQGAVSIFQTDVICDFAPPIDVFDHRWVDPDTDSSDEDNLKASKAVVYRTIDGDVVVEKPKPLHSTYSQRMADRAQNKHHIGITRFEDGKEIPPPQPKQKKPPKPKESAFNGAARTIKDDGERKSVQSGKKEEISDVYKGVSRTTK